MQHSNEIQREQRAWRQQMLTGLAWSLVAASAFGTTWYALVRNVAAMVPVLAGATIVMGAVAVLQAVSYALRAWTLLAVLYAACFYGVLLAGFAPNPVVGLSTLVIAAALLLGRRAGLLAAAVASLSLLSVSI